MTAMTKRFKIISILLSVVLIIGIACCGSGKSKKTANKGKSVQITQEASAGTTGLNTAAPAPVSTGDQEDIPVQLRILPTTEFGRENPFIPLVSTGIGARTTASEKSIVDRPVAKTIVKKPEPPPLPNIRLSLVIDGNTAILEDNRSSKVVSVGDTVSGMKVLEIRSNEAVLSSGTKKLIVSQGGVREESPAPVSTQAENIPKNTKIKKK